MKSNLEILSGVQKLVYFINLDELFSNLNFTTKYLCRSHRSYKNTKLNQRISYNLCFNYIFLMVYKKIIKTKIVGIFFKFNFAYKYSNMVASAAKLKFEKSIGDSHYYLSTPPRVLCRFIQNISIDISFYSVVLRLYSHDF